MTEISMTCSACNLRMDRAAGCTVSVLVYEDGERWPAIKYGEEGWADESCPPRCHDCGARKGYYHHARCDVERCPRCNGQLLVCGCGEVPWNHRRPRR